MSNLDERQRDDSVGKSESMVQYAFNKYNNMRGNVKEAIKATPNLDREVRQAREKYKAAKVAMQNKNEQMPIVTAQDIKDEMYR